MHGCVKASYQIKEILKSSIVNYLDAYYQWKIQSKAN